MRFQPKPHLFLFFIVAQFQVKLAKKCLNYFLTFWHQKMKLADGFMCETDIKLWNRPEFSQEKKNETDGTRLRRGRQFHFFFLTESGRFHNFSQFHTWNHSQFHFLSQKAEKIQTFFASFTWNWPHTKKKVRFPAKT